MALRQSAMNSSRSNIVPPILKTRATLASTHYGPLRGRTRSFSSPRVATDAGFAIGKLGRAVEVRNWHLPDHGDLLRALAPRGLQRLEDCDQAAVALGRELGNGPAGGLVGDAIDDLLLHIRRELGIAERGPPVARERHAQMRHEMGHAAQ